MSEEQIDQPVTEEVTPAVTEEVSSTTEPIPVVATDSSAPVEVFFEGAKVEKVIEVSADGLRLCQMSDGTTKHVPAELFN